MLDVDGVSLAVHDSDAGGTRPGIVCLHAIGHGGADFSRFEDAFAAEYRIITVDWPGQGASGNDHQPASAARYRELFELLVAKLGLERFVIVGNSIGGAVAVGYAAAHPEKVRALILSNPGGFDPGGILAGLYIRNLERHFRAGVEGDPSYKDWFRGYYEGILVTAEGARERDAIIESAYEIAPRLLEAWQSFRMPGADQRALAARLTMPVLVAWAEKDALVTFARNREAIESIPNGHLQMFQAGHAPFVETPAEFNRAAAAFLHDLPR
jgi:4,5:9,10-diseco-3-hydroxy-5,9,17-trioxoandrosta-1(10),2-diene-4-oate hydrolase